MRALPYWNDNQTLIGWGAITQYAKDTNLPCGHSETQLREMSKTLGFPTFKNRYGRVCARPWAIEMWLITFQDKSQWWPNGRPGKKSRAWEELQYEMKEQMAS